MIPWNCRKYWVIPPRASGAFVAAIEEVLSVYTRPQDPDRPAAYTTIPIGRGFLYLVAVVGGRGQAGPVCPGGCPTRRTLYSVSRSRRWRRRWPGTASPRPSTVPGQPVNRGDFASLTEAARVSKDGRVAGWTTSSSNASGALYLKGYANGREAKAGVSDWIAFLQRAPP